MKNHAVKRNSSAIFYFLTATDLAETLLNGNHVDSICKSKKVVGAHLYKLPDRFRSDGPWKIRYVTLQNEQLWQMAVVKYFANKLVSKTLKHLDKFGRFDSDAALEKLHRIS